MTHCAGCFRSGKWMHKRDTQWGSSYRRNSCPPCPGNPRFSQMIVANEDPAPLVLHRVTDLGGFLSGLPSQGSKLGEERSRPGPNLETRFLNAVHRIKALSGQRARGWGDFSPRLCLSGMDHNAQFVKQCDKLRFHIFSGIKTGSRRTLYHRRSRRGAPGRK
jgi:hypothetical protein